MKRKLIAALLVCLAQLPLAFESAQAFPDRPIKIVVASPPGGPLARLLTEQTGAALGQPVIVAQISVE